jgi:hypothetical protein
MVNVRYRISKLSVSEELLNSTVMFTCLDSLLPNKAAFEEGTPNNLLWGVKNRLYKAAYTLVWLGAD